MAGTSDRCISPVRALTCRQIGHRPVRFVTEAQTCVWLSVPVKNFVTDPTLELGGLQVAQALAASDTAAVQQVSSATPAAVPTQQPLSCNRAN